MAVRRYLADEPKVEVEVKSGDEQESHEQLTVEAFQNHLYFYSDVNPDRCLALMRLLRETDQWIRAESLSRGVATTIPIWLHINSGGGDVFSAFAVADQIEQIPTPVYSIIEGLGASAATLISVSCQRRFIQPSAYVLIHQFRTWFVGTHEAFKDEMDLQEMLIGRMISFYATKTKMQPEDVREKLKHDFWMDAQSAIDYGIADQIYTGLVETEKSV